MTDLPPTPPAPDEQAELRRLSGRVLSVVAASQAATAQAALGLIRAVAGGAAATDHDQIAALAGRSDQASTQSAALREDARGLQRRADRLGPDEDVGELRAELQAALEAGEGLVGEAEAIQAAIGDSAS